MTKDRFFKALKARILKIESEMDEDLDLEAEGWWEEVRDQLDVFVDELSNEDEDGEASDDDDEPIESD
jgi:hypothetical protein